MATCVGAGRGPGRFCAQAVGATAMFTKTTGTVALREVGGLCGNGKKVTTPDPPQGTVSDVGIGFGTPYLVKVTAPIAPAAGGGAPKKTEMDVALLPV
jgi:hypothetical protein